jgi:hypothetical protein
MVKRKRQNRSVLDWPVYTALAHTGLTFHIPRPPQLAIPGGRRNEKGAAIPRRILKIGGENALEKI